MTRVVDRGLFATSGQMAGRRRRRSEGDGAGTLRQMGAQAEALARRLREPPVHPALFSVILRCADALVLLISGLVIFALPMPAAFRSGAFDVTVLVSGIGLTVSALGLMQAYRFRRLRSFLSGAALALAALFVGFSLSIALLVALGYPLDWLLPPVVLWGAVSLNLMLLVRMALAWRIRQLIRSGVLEHRIVLLGGGAPLSPLISEIDSEKRLGRRLCGFFDERSEPRSPDIIGDYHKLGDLEDLVQFGRLAHIHSVIVAMPTASPQRLMELGARLAVLPVDVWLAIDDCPAWLSGNRRGALGKVRTVLLHKAPINNWQAFQKRVFDLVLGSFALALMAPLMVVVALAVKIESPGPILFRQKRHGYNNKPIWVWKFRSMYADRCDPSAIRAVRRNDNRVTRLGRFIRRSSIDELPQLVNVLSGEMSLVGPRPHATAARTGDIIYDTVAESYSARHRVKPGVTGWAQINGWRGEMNSPEKIRARVEHDLHYIENWSVWLDLTILLRTPLSLITTRNAY
ncbi:MAG: undecaprenyl-phosphate glucose phosphotransferase [Pararhodobacter sp.]|nr:undecaprenyl-phosphate glucose phosphotransferase [Pararhodobacter sp.]